MRKYLTMLVLLIAGTAAFAQQHSVKGTVVDSQGYPVIGMTVMERVLKTVPLPMPTVTIF